MKAIALQCNNTPGLPYKTALRAVREAVQMNYLERVEQLVTHESERLVKPYLDAIDRGDWKASEALADRHYGKSTQRIEQSSPSLREQLQALGPAEREALRARVLDEIERRTRTPAGELAPGPDVSQSPSTGT